jgi:hypothetical protein
MYRLTVGCIWAGSNVSALGGMARFRVSVAFDDDDEAEFDDPPSGEQAARGSATAIAAATAAIRNRRRVGVRNNSNSLV